MHAPDDVTVTTTTTARMAPMRGMTDVLRSRIATLGELILLLTTRALDDAGRLAGARTDATKMTATSATDDGDQGAATAAYTPRSTTTSMTACTVVRVTRSVRKAAPLSLARLQTARGADLRAQSCPLGGAATRPVRAGHAAVTTPPCRTVDNNGSSSSNNGSNSSSSNNVATSGLCAGVTVHVDAQCDNDHGGDTDEVTAALLAQSAAWFAAFLQRGARNGGAEVGNGGGGGSSGCNASSPQTRTRGASSEHVVVFAPPSSSSCSSRAVAQHACGNGDTCRHNDDHVARAHARHEAASDAAVLPSQRTLSADEVQDDMRAARTRDVCRVLYDAHDWSRHRHDTRCAVAASAAS